MRWYTSTNQFRVTDVNAFDRLMGCMVHDGKNLAAYRHEKHVCFTVDGRVKGLADGDTAGFLDRLADILPDGTACIITETGTPDDGGMPECGITTVTKHGTMSATLRSVGRQFARELLDDPDYEPEYPE